MINTEYNGTEIDGYHYDHQDLLDLYRLQKVLLEEKGLLATLEECVNIWQNYSNDLSASWLCFPKKDTDILRHISSSDYFTSFEQYALI